MACRCIEITAYEDDIKVLDNIITKAEELKKLMYAMHEDIDELDGYYSKTIYPTERLHTAFSNLDKGKASNIAGILSRTKAAKYNAEQTLKALREEDDACDPDEHVKEG